MSSEISGESGTPPPRYERLLDPRPPPPDNILFEYASGRPNDLDAWDHAGLPGGPSSRLDGEAGSSRVLNDRDLFEERDLDLYRDDPYRPAAPGKQIIVTHGPTTDWLHCHHKVFPAFWRCPSCPPHSNCLNMWDIRAMDDPTSTYYQPPDCFRPSCGAPIINLTVIVNTQKESIMTVGGENLMPSRVEEPFMWCCQCAALRGQGREREPECVHCLNHEQSRCDECFRCNDFLEPTSFCNGEMVEYGVFHLHARGLAIKEGRAAPDARYARIFANTQLPRGDSRHVIWKIIGSAIALGDLFFDPPRPVSQQVRVVDAPIHAVTRRHPESRHSQSRVQFPNSYQRQHHDSQRPSLSLDLRDPPRPHPSGLRRDDRPPWEDELHMDRHVINVINERRRPPDLLAPDDSVSQHSSRPPTYVSNHRPQQWQGDWDIASSIRQRFPSSPGSVASSARASRPRATVPQTNVDNSSHGPGVGQAPCTCRGCEEGEKTTLCGTALENYQR